MSSQKKINPSQVQNFVRVALKHKLREDFRELRIIKESDIETCAYYHLRTFLRKDPRWNILARYFAKNTGHYIDLVIFRNSKPKIAIEIKWNRKKISRKDRRSLCRSLKPLGAKKAYCLTLLRDRSKYIRMSKRKNEKYRLHEIRVGLDWPSDRMKDWELKRNPLRQKMEPVGVEK
jgi:hypothetical protein